ncbi:MAG: NAD-dependent epimerase/dehydratase family protein [Gammaproteobacteria bacterium]|nr:NAD-dependent epimerase/dehydratase family protein [Gammaproteobacteria bacterium]
MRKNILITGGAGNIGGSLARRLVQNQEYKVVIVDDLSTGMAGKLPDRTYNNWKFIKANVNDFNDIAPVVISGNFDLIFHYAAVVGVQRTLTNPKLVLNDIEGIKNILDLAKNTGVERVIYSSSSEVYGEPVEIPQREATTPLNSRLPYAIVKNIGEAFCRTYEKEYGLKYTIFRFFNTYGPLQSKDFVVSRFIYWASRNEDLIIYGDGSQTRTFCYIDDNLDFTETVITNDLCINDVVNVGSDNEITILELAKLVLKITNSRSRIVHYPPLKEGDMSRRKPDNSIMRSMLKRELIKLEDGIRKSFEYLKNSDDDILT